MLLDIDQIRTDGGTQTRASLSDVVIAEYAEAMEVGAKFPDLIVFHDGSDYWLGDGFHRLGSYKRIGAEAVPVDVRQGTRRDAILYSVGANSDHGLRRTIDDKRRAVQTLLADEEWAKRSDRWLAEQAGVTHPFVGKVRVEVCGPASGDGDVRQTKDGRTRTVTPKRDVEEEPSADHDDDHGDAEEGNDAADDEAGAESSPPPPPPLVTLPEKYSTMTARDTAQIAVNNVHVAAKSFRAPDWALFMDQLTRAMAQRSA